MQKRENKTKEKNDECYNFYYILQVGIYWLVLWMQNVEEAERPSEGFYIRSGITVILKNSTIRDGTVI